MIRAARGIPPPSAPCAASPPSRTPILESSGALLTELRAAEAVGDWQRALEVADAALRAAAPALLDARPLAPDALAALLGRARALESLGMETRALEDARTCIRCIDAGVELCSAAQDAEPATLAAADAARDSLRRALHLQLSLAEKAERFDEAIKAAKRLRGELDDPEGARALDRLVRERRRNEQIEARP